MPVHFQGDIAPSIRRSFETALEGYPEFKDHDIILRQRTLRDMTMRAQPLFNLGIFRRGRRDYRIDLQDYTRINDQISVDELEHDVMVGWFAHELGHVMDYFNRPWYNLLGFGLGYLLFPTFRVGAERKADLFAIEHGFADEVLATKHFLLNESSIPNSYKDRLNRYYMTPEEVQLIVEKKLEGTVFRDRII